MLVLRVFAGVFALALIVGELLRAWGVERAEAIWIGDVLLGAALVSAAWTAGTETMRARAFFTGAWGAALAGTYLTAVAVFFDSVTVEIGNFSLLQLQVAAGAAFAASTIGFFASILLPFGDAPVRAGFEGSSADVSGLWHAADRARTESQHAPDAAARTAEAPQTESAS